MCGKNCNLAYWQEQRKLLLQEKESINKEFAAIKEELKQTEIDLNLAAIVVEAKEDPEGYKNITRRIDNLNNRVEMVGEHMAAFNEAIDRRISITEHYIKIAEAK